METNKLTIHENLTCPICHKEVKLLKWGKLTDCKTLTEIVFNVEHVKCRSLTRKKDKLTNELMDLEMKVKNKKAELVNLEYRLFQEIIS